MRIKWKGFIKGIIRRNFLINKQNWYQNFNGAYVHPHCLAVLTFDKLMNLTDEEFERYWKLTE